jgi:hypothetical protein
MPRTADIYAVPPGTDGVPNATIGSAPYNNFLRDIEYDLNLPRPIVAGGTGGNTAAAARTSLGAEVSAPNQTVTNYDSHVWQNGSFASNPGATAAPEASGTYFGTAIASTDNNSVIIEARNLSTGITYMRRKVSGVWQNSGAWVNDSGSDKVAKAGDTMTGALQAPVKGNVFGNAGGSAASGAVATTDANIILYGSGQNWAGIGTDSNGNMWFRAALSGTPIPQLRVLTDGTVALTYLFANGYASRTGISGVHNSNYWNLNWQGTGIDLWINVANLGQITTSCDYRIKHNVEPLRSTWEAVKQLKPISFQYKDYGEFKGSDDLQWGFVAHELQETLLPTAARGKKDEENVIQSPNLLAVVAALTKTIQELQARVEALETQQ